jgi:hypothetical protein
VNIPGTPWFDPAQPGRQTVVTAAMVAVPAGTERRQFRDRPVGVLAEQRPTSSDR